MKKKFFNISEKISISTCDMSFEKRADLGTGFCIHPRLQNGILQHGGQVFLLDHHIYCISADTNNLDHLKMSQYLHCSGLLLQSYSFPSVEEPALLSFAQYQVEDQKEPDRDSNNCGV